MGKEVWNMCGRGRQWSDGGIREVNRYHTRERDSKAGVSARVVSRRRGGVMNTTGVEGSTNVMFTGGVWRWRVR
jgi:hypothetical protein